MSKFVQDGLCRIILYDDSTSPDTYVNTSGILAPGVQVNEQYFQTAAGNERLLSRERVIEIELVDLENLWQLIAWSTANTDLRGIIVGNSRCIQIDDDFNIKMIPVHKGRENLAAWRLRIYTSSINADWAHYVNLLQKTSDGYVDDNADNIPDGWAVSNYDDAAGSVSAAGVWSFEANAAGDCYGRVDIPMPASNEAVGTAFTLTASITVDTAYVGSGDAYLMICPDADSTSIGAGAVALTSTGRKSCSMPWPGTLDKPTDFVTVYAPLLQGDATGTVGVSWPTLRVDGVTEKTRY